MTDYYVSRGFALGDVPSVADTKDKLAGEIVLSPPSALGDRWSRRFADPLAGFASGWMRIRGRVRQRGIELPLIISDHCDWVELLRTITETGAGEVWVADLVARGRIGRRRFRRTGKHGQARCAAASAVRVGPAAKDGR